MSDVVPPFPPGTTHELVIQETCPHAAAPTTELWIQLRRRTRKTWRTVDDVDVSVYVPPLIDWTPDTFDQVVRELAAWLSPDDPTRVTVRVAMTAGGRWMRTKVVRIVLTTPELQAIVPRRCGLALSQPMFTWLEHVTARRTPRPGL